VTVKFLLDTNIVSEPLRPQPNKNILEKLKNHQKEMAIASLVWHELMSGMNRLPASKKQEAIQQYLEAVVLPTLPILPYDANAAQWHAQERARLSKLGCSPAFVDGQIAAVAKTNNLILVTINESDFNQFQGLQIENWQR